LQTIFQRPEGLNRHGGGCAGTLLFFAGALSGLGLLLLPLEFFPGQFEMGEVAEGINEREEQFRLFFEPFAQLARIETVEDIKKVQVHECVGGGIEL